MKTKVTLYSKVGCGECMFTKKFLEKNNIDYQEINISEVPERAEEVTEMGFRSLPVVLIDGEKPFNGFKPEKLQALVG